MTDPVAVSEALPPGKPENEKCCEGTMAGSHDPECVNFHTSEAERTVASIAMMLGWMNVPPQRVLEADIAALKARARAAPVLQPGLRELIETLGMHIAGMEENLDNVKFARALNRSGAKALGQEFDDSNETPMPYVHVFEDEIVMLRALHTKLAAPDPRGEPRT